MKIVLGDMKPLKFILEKKLFLNFFWPDTSRSLSPEGEVIPQFKINFNHVIHDINLTFVESKPIRKRELSKEKKLVHRDGILDCTIR